MITDTALFLGLPLDKAVGLAWQAWGCEPAILKTTSPREKDPQGLWRVLAVRENSKTLVAGCFQPAHFEEVKP